MSSLASSYSSAPAEGAPRAAACSAAAATSAAMVASGPSAAFVRCRARSSTSLTVPAGAAVHLGAQLGWRLVVQHGREPPIVNRTRLRSGSTTPASAASSSAALAAVGPPVLPQSARSSAIQRGRRSVARCACPTTGEPVAARASSPNCSVLAAARRIAGASRAATAPAPLRGRRTDCRPSPRAPSAVPPARARALAAPEGADATHPG